MKSKPLDEVLDYCFALGWFVGNPEKWRKALSKGEKLMIISAYKKNKNSDSFEYLVQSLRYKYEKWVFEQ